MTIEESLDRGKSLDGEKTRDIIQNSKDPQQLPLGQLVKEIVNYTRLIPLIDLCGNKPDYVVLRDAIESRLKKLYCELDRREESYQDHQRRE